MRTLRKKNNRRRLIAVSVVTGNVLILAVVVTVIVTSSHNGSADAPLAAVAQSGDNAVSNPLDHVSSANIAQTVARMSNLPETIAVTNQADSETTELSMAPATTSVVEKPQMISSTAFASNKDIKSYTTVSGDTITSIAAKFGVTSDSIRWSNNLTGDAVNVGVSLLIPPVTGIVYTVQSGDTPASLATKYKADQSKIIAFNDAELSGLQVGERILIPDGSKIVIPVGRSTSSWTGSASYGGYNGYDFGYCTYWVAKLRSQNGNAVPTNLGNAATWAVRAAAMGLPTGTTPRIGAAVVTSTKGAGHVAYVTGVNDDGTITISEMNHAGWNKVDTRTLADTGFRYVY
jgi:N-acetylmuramoyl-L-alanine amidase